MLAVMSRADHKLRSLIREWESACPRDVTEIEDLKKATTATDKLAKALASARQELKQKSSDYEEITADEVQEKLQTLKDYRKELSELESSLAELKKWLSKVRTSADPLPFALVAKGNSKGSLHVFKQDKRVEREARSGKQEISGAKIFDGECVYDGGKLVFKFHAGPRAPWKSLLQDIVNQAGVNMKVALDGLGDDDDAAGGPMIA
jgi:seryl-tRNA synthetase